MAYAERRLEGFSREIVLGLVVQAPSNCYQLDKRVRQRFRSAQYARGIANSAIKRLEADGMVRPRTPSKLAALAAVGGREATVWEATEAGIKHFEAWMWASVSTPPVREELLAKVALCGPRDLPRMVELVHEAEMVCMGRLQDLNFRARSRREEMDLRRWDMRMDLAISTGDYAWWDSRVKWLQKLRRHLEEELREVECGAPGALRPVV